jgi:hypothetical protein
MALHIKRVIAILGVPTLIEAIRAFLSFSRHWCTSQAALASSQRPYARSGD